VNVENEMGKVFFEYLTQVIYWVSPLTSIPYILL